MTKRVALCLCLFSLLVGAAFCQEEEGMTMAMMPAAPAEEDLMTMTMPIEEPELPDDSGDMELPTTMPAPEEAFPEMEAEDPRGDLMKNMSATNETAINDVDLTPLDDLETEANNEGDEPTVVNIGSSPPGDLIYDPETVTIGQGDTVTWVNVDGIPHDVVFDKVPEGANKEDLSHPELFGTIGQNVSSTFTVPGTYEYYCTPHLYAGMVAKVIVE